MVTVVITSCNRLNLLKRTIDSFMKYNTYPITEYILIDDSGDKKAHEWIRATYPDFKLLLDTHHRGQVHCIDNVYSHVTTPYLFHLEDDWEFTRESFIEPSLKILEAELKIMQAWLMWGNAHPILPAKYKIGGVECRLMDWTIGCFGLTWNPGLRRLSDYKLIAPFTDYFIGDNLATTAEWYAGQALVNLGLRAVILNEEYCHHIGEHQRTKR
jgi:hypothetical protein